MTHKRGALPTPYVPGMSGLTVMARGGYATVYRAVQESVGREVAIKVENRPLDDPRDQARFLREAKAAGRMSSHPHVVDLFDVGVTVDRHPYLIMELCDGSYLERMRRSPLGPAEARDLGVKIADALVHSHANGVLHRDVKPANILYSHFNPAVLADFGLAVLGEVRDGGNTLEVLTPAYAPPEMFHHATPTGAVDVYALCATLYAVMRGRPPRWDTDHSPSLVTLLELFDRPVPDLPGVPGALTEVLRYGMANDPAERPTAAQLRDLLTDLALTPDGPPPDRPARAAPFRPPGPPSGPLPGRPPGPPPPAWPEDAGDDTPTVHTDRPRRRRLFGGFGAVLLLGAAAGVLLAPGGPAAVRAAAARLLPGTAAGASAPAARLPGCAAGDAVCTDELECYADRPGAGAARVPCDGRHTWEAFARGVLPAGVAAGDRAAVTAAPAVRRVCSTATFTRTTGRDDHARWRLSVLPPAAGDRTFRCLAGRGPGALRGPVLGGA